MNKTLVICSTILSLAFGGVALAGSAGKQNLNAPGTVDAKSGLSKTKTCCWLPPKKGGYGK